MYDKYSNCKDEVSFYILWGRIRAGWKTIVLGAALGMACAYASIVATAPRYEAVALLQGGQVALLQAAAGGPKYPGYPIQLIESSAQMVERIRSVPLQTRVFQKAGAQGTILAQVVKSTSTDDSPLIELKILGNSPDHLTQIGEAVVADLVNIQEPMFRTWIKLLEDEIRILEERVTRGESELNNASRQVYRSGGQATVGQMTILSACQARQTEYVSILRERLLAGKAALSMTHRVRTIEPFTVSGPLSSNSRLMLVVGALGGLIAGVFLVLAMHTWRCEKQA